MRDFPDLANRLSMFKVGSVVKLKLRRQMSEKNKRRLGVQLFIWCVEHGVCIRPKLKTKCLELEHLGHHQLKGTDFFYFIRNLCIPGPLVGYVDHYGDLVSKSRMEFTEMLTLEHDWIRKPLPHPSNVVIDSECDELWRVKSHA